MPGGGARKNSGLSLVYSGIVHFCRYTYFLILQVFVSLLQVHPRGFFVYLGSCFIASLLHCFIALLVF